MNCEKIQSSICWYLYNELDEAERTALEDHLETCRTCTGELEREKGFLSRVDARERLEPPAGMLAECRHDLMRSIYRAERLRQRSLEGRWRPVESFREAWVRLGAWRQPIAATCLLAAGFIGGMGIRSQAHPNGALNPNDALISNISAVSLDPRAGQVEISFDEMRRQKLSGNTQDPRIQQFLIFAARSYSNPGVRMDTIDILKDRAGDQDVKGALLYLLGNDRNPGVRLKALESVKDLARNADVRRALIQVLTTDDNPGMRVQAIDLLMQGPDRSLVEVLQGVAQKEDNNYVRMRCQNALREMNASVETF